jgi:hypothetical protein
MGYEVSFYGGELDSSLFQNKDYLTGPNFGLLFSGHVRFIYTRYFENGNSYLLVTCIDVTWSRGAYTNNYFAYPSVNSKRQWAGQSTSLKLSEIVEGIVKTEMGMPLEIHLGHDPDYFDFQPAVQHNKTDWAFLRSLAEENSCYVWTNHAEGNTTIYFVDKSKVVNSPGRYELVWIARAGSGFIQGSHLPTGDNVKESTKLKGNQIQIIALDIAENPQAEGMNVQVVSDFSSETGEVTETLVSYDETKDEIIYYELNQSAVDELQKTEEGRKEADLIMSFGPMDIPKDVFMRFYIPVKIEKKDLRAIDKPFLGITLTATIRGNVNIVPFQSYPVQGIARYGSKNSASGNYYLRAIRYIFADDFRMELTLIR